MCKPPHLNDAVFISCFGIDELDEQDTALYRTKVVEESVGQVKVDLPKGAVSKWIHKTRVHRAVGMLLIEIGDFVTEAATLDPLAKSITQFCRLIVPDDYIRFVKVRSLAEIKSYWDSNHGAYQYVILIAHGDKGVVCTAMDGRKPASAWRAVFEGADVVAKNFLFSVCKAGDSAFARDFSKSPVCNYYIGPYQSVKPAISSQFIQSFVSFRFVGGQKENTAFRNGRKATADGTSFRLWRGGKLNMK